MPRCRKEDEQELDKDNVSEEADSGEVEQHRDIDLPPDLAWSPRSVLMVDLDVCNRSICSGHPLLLN